MKQGLEPDKSKKIHGTLKCILKRNQKEIDTSITLLRSFIHSSVKYLLRAHCVKHSDRPQGHNNKQSRQGPALMEFIFYWGEKERGIRNVMCKSKDMKELKC